MNRVGLTKVVAILALGLVGADCLGSFFPSCEKDTDCVKSPAKSEADRRDWCFKGLCVECNANKDCHAEDGEICANRRCVMKAGWCSTNADCARLLPFAYDGKKSVCRKHECVRE